MRMVILSKVRSVLDEGQKKSNRVNIVILMTSK